MEKTVNPGKRIGIVTIPPSKSDAQRTYLSAALARGKSTISGWGDSDDERSMRTAIEQLGAELSFSDRNELIVWGMESFPETATISAGESGLGIRLLANVCAAFNGTFTINGEGSLQTRPMDFFEENLPKFGASCTTSNGKTPIVITGPMKGSNVTVDGSLSSQFISGLLMALPLLEEDSELEVTDLKSSPYVEMTLQTLQAFGIAVEHTDLTTFHIPGDQTYQSTHYQIDADWSSASYWLVAAALGHSIELKGLRLDSFQADKALMSFLQAANCQLNFNGPLIGVEGAKRKAFSVDATNCPDLFPALVTLAAFCVGTTIIRGALRLEHKESHRGLTLQEEFGKLGVEIDLVGDKMLIHGTGIVKGGTVTSHHDHRIAMCLGIAGLLSEGPITITDAEAVSKSYPEFWTVLESLEAGVLL